MSKRARAEGWTEEEEEEENPAADEVVESIATADMAAEPALARGRPAARGRFDDAETEGAGAAPMGRTTSRAEPDAAPAPVAAEEEAERARESVEDRFLKAPPPDSLSSKYKPPPPAAAAAAGEPADGTRC
jgi:hypothetical protein